MVSMGFRKHDIFGLIVSLPLFLVALQELFFLLGIDELEGDLFFISLKMILLFTILHMIVVSFWWLMLPATIVFFFYYYKRAIKLGTFASWLVLFVNLTAVSLVVLLYLIL